MKLEVEKEMIEPIIRDQIAAAIVRELGNTEELVKTMVDLALNKKVNRDGKVGQYSSDNKFDFVEAVAGKAIRDAASEAIGRLVEEQKPEIEKAIRRELRMRPAKTAAAIIAAFADAGTSRYRINATFSFSGTD